MKRERMDALLGAALAFYLMTSLFSQALMSIGAGLLALATIYVALSDRRARGELLDNRARVYFSAALALALACVLSLVSARLNPMGYGGKFIIARPFSDSLKLWYLFEPLALLWILRELSRAARTRALKCWIGAFSVLSLVGIIQFFTGWPRPQPSSLQGFYHATLFLGHHLSVASIWIFPFFLLLDASRDSEVARRLGLSPSRAGVFAFLGFCTLILTWSRTLWVALPVALVVWALLSLSKKGSLSLLSAGILGVVCLSLIPAIRARFTDVYGLITRQDLWLANLEFFRTRPWLGVGWRHNHELSGYYFEITRPRGDLIFSGHAHNNFLDALSGTGALGALAWLIWSGTVFWVIWRKPRFPGARALLCAWIAFHLNGLTQLNFWEGKVTHQMMISIALALFWAREERVNA